MSRIHVLTTDRCGKSRSFAFPLRINSRLLAECGYTVSIFHAPDEELFDCEALFIDRSYFGEPWAGLTENVDEVLVNGRTRSGKVLWFDTSDSTGTTQFEVLPYVDLYCKSQVLAHRADYLQNFKGNRIFTDFYDRLYGPSDEIDTAPSVLPQSQDLSRLCVSWSCALGDHCAVSGLARSVRRLFTKTPAYTCRFVPPRSPRRHDIVCRLGMGHRRLAMRKHREGVRTILERDFGVRTDRIPRRRYLREMRAARVGISPFGYGEICIRDFEVILAGAALVKPSMDHLETWPPLYVPNETYVVHRWDLSDLREQLERLLEGHRWQEIANHAQTLYRHYLLERDGREEFCGRVLGVIDAAHRGQSRVLEERVHSSSR